MTNEQENAIPCQCKITIYYPQEWANENLVQAFLRAADAWVCDTYSLDIRYFGDLQGSDHCVMGCIHRAGPAASTITI
jgi:hypothetical protein